MQRTIDRIIFLRICEDRGIETYGQLMALRNGQDVYRRLCEVFRNADDRYNSGLFHFRKEKDRGESPDELTLNLRIDDRVLKDIFKDLYYPDSPYEFSVLPADILGHIYEQFLGKVIRLTPAHRAVVEEKPEVRKAGGVYYTPTYIVDYIVEQTVGKLLEGRTPSRVAKLRVLDPACGSGSFLLGAYQRLLDWHLDWYSKHEPEKRAKGRKQKVFQGPGGDWRLTSAEKKRILLNNVYGVDIDPQAVEVTKLSLLLKVLEGESEETLGKTLRMFHERALPDLRENIKCGNSLIGPDFYEGKQLSLIDEEERYRINAFDWDAEFPEIMKAGGFDAVIGNPPYVGFHGFESEKPYLRAEYDSAQGRFDIYLPFVEKGMALLKGQGVLGHICPTNFMKREHGAGLRRLLLEQTKLIEITDFEDVQIFRRATNYTGVFVVRKATPDSTHAFTYKSRDLNAPGFEVAQSSLSASPWIIRSTEANRVISTVDGAAVDALDVLSKSIGEGIVTGCNDVFLLSAEDATATGLEKTLIQPLLRGKEISRYRTAAPSEYVVYPYYEDGKHTRAYTEDELARHPSAFSYLVRHRERLEKRSYLKQTTKQWFELWRPRSLGILRTRKIVTPELSSRNRFALVGEEILFGDTACGVVLEGDVQEEPQYVLALLNSRLLSFYYRQTTVPKAGGYLIYKTMYLKRIPIRRIDFDDPAEVRMHAKLCHLVESMMALHLRVRSARSRHSQDVIKREIDVSDKQIDQLVYKLYGLTNKEIRIVEEATRA